MVEYRQAYLKELDEVKAVLWDYGPNEWNHLTSEGVEAEFSLVENGNAQVIVAINDNEIIGFAVLIDGLFCPNYLKKYCQMEQMKFVGDVVVSSLHSGKGVATKLLEECLSAAKTHKVSTVLIERHQENLASAGMMRKAGFEIVDTFYDPEKRVVGSRNSVILQYVIKRDH